MRTSIMSSLAQSRATLTVLSSILLISCKTKSEEQNTWIEKEISISKAKEIAQLKAEGYEIFDYYDEEIKDTVIMQKYFVAFLMNGPNRDQSKEAADSLQVLHQEHLGRMYNAGFADLSGPFEDPDGETRGITIYNVPTLKIADSLANLDPMVQAGRLKIHIKPWWAGKGYGLR